MPSAAGLSAGALTRWRAGPSRVLARHRRLVAALMLAIAAGIAVDAAAAEAPPGLPVVAAATDLPAGAVLSAGDVTAAQAPPELVPDGSADVGSVVGRRLGAPLRRGELVTDAALLGPGLLVGQPAGSVAVPVRPSDPPPPGLVRPGDRVRVLAGPAPSAVDAFGTGSGPADVVVASATVLAVPDDGDAGLLGGEASAVLLLAVTGAEALALATASDGRWLSVAILP